MRQMTTLLTLHSARQGLLEITDRITRWSDMPAHLRTALTQVQLAIPVVDGRLALGTWQGIYLFEHRRRPQSRTLALHLIGEMRDA